jgi:hypothetical protein
MVPRRLTCLPIASLVILALACCGCGSKGPERFHVSGKVTANGKPIPAGTITFEPQGKGLQGFATIKDGQYDTRQGGKGHSGGPTTARVAAYDGIVANELPMGKPMGPEVLMKLDLPTSDSTQDIDTKDGAPVASATPEAEQAGP